MKKIRVASVSYLNARPLIYGVQDYSPLQDKMILVEDYPSKLVKMLEDDEVDVGLVSVAAIPKLKDPHIISNYVIAAEGDVASVCLFSEVPLEEITTVLLDYQSRTSINLCKILMKFLWKKEVEFILTTGEFVDEIKGTTAGVIIGDRALVQLNNFKYIYDLAREWRKLTGKPFLFAAWIANKPLPEEFVQIFNEANSHWEKYLDQIVTEKPFPAYDLKYYFTHNINYDLTADMKDALQMFLDYSKEIDFI